MAKKNYFYRVEPQAVLSEMICVPKEEWGEWALKFFRELSAGDPEAATISIVSEIIREANSFRAKKSEDGIKGMAARWANDN